MKKIALVLGGTGHVGSAIVRALCQRDWQVRVLSRRPSPPLNLQGLDVEFHQTSWNIAQKIDDSLDQCQLFIDAASPYALNSCLPHSTARKRLVEDARVRTEKIIDCISRRKVSMGYISSFTTLCRHENSDPLDQIMGVTNRLLHPYFEVKETIEDALVQAARQGQRITIVNPTLCVGPWESRPKDQCFIPQIVLGQMPVVINNTVNTIDVRDVAESLLRALEKEIVGEPIQLAGYNQSWRSLHEMATSIHGAQSVPITLPLPPLWAAGHTLDAIFKSLGVRSPLSSLITALMAEHRITNMLPLQRSLGLRLRAPRTTMADALNWYQKLGYL